MAIGSGIGAQVGFAAESTPGTAATVTRFLEFNSESLTYEPTFIEGVGMRAGSIGKRISRVVQSRVTAGGSIEMDFATRGMGLLLKHMTGSATTAPTSLGSGAYKQVHAPSDYTGLSLTTQVGRPQTDGTVRPFTYTGCTVTGWTFSVTDGELATLSLDLDAMNESTAIALATASYTTASSFNFAQVLSGGFTVGGTPSTTSGVISVAGASNVASIVRSFSLTGTVPRATERYGLGNSGVKSSQIVNDHPVVTGTLETEFSNQAEFYDLYKANTTTALRLAFTGSLIGGSIYNGLEIILPAVKIKSAPVNVGGPDILSMSVEFEAYVDDTNNNAQYQFALTSADSAI